MKKYLPLIILCCLSGVALAQMTAIDANTVQMTVSQTQKVNVKNLCHMADIMLNRAETLENECQFAENMVNGLNAQTNNATMNGS